jgi:hypothetical protein
VKTNLNYRLFIRGTVALAAFVFATSSAHANLVTNGSFEGWSDGTTSSQFGSRFPGQTLTGWNDNGGYDFVFTPSDPDADSQYGGQDVALWGPGNGGVGPATLGPSPDGGNFVAIDGPFNSPPNGAALTQTINGLVAGQQYVVSFYWAAAQQGPAPLGTPPQAGFTGPTTEEFDVSLGGQTIDTSVLTNVSMGFSGWNQATMTFTADTTGSELLSFLAVGTPTANNAPPFALLDGVSLTSATPEPSSLALLATGLLSAGGFVRSRFKKA